MLVGITADLHLTSQKEHPYRYHALADILNSCIAMNIEYLIIAGDLFDQNKQNYAEFEKVCNKSKYEKIKIFIIPGNHDNYLKNSDLILANISVITETKLITFNQKEPYFLFVPYKSDTVMGEEIRRCSEHLEPNQWNLIGHGDWGGNIKNLNDYESGLYMPLSKMDMSIYRPRNIFLGHIHKPLDEGILHYVGSPCGIDITETGHRRFLVYDIDKNVVSSHRVNNSKIFFEETVTIFPTDDEISFLKKEMQKCIDAWDITPSDRDKAIIRVKVQGYTTDRNRISECLKDLLQDYQYYKDSQPDLTNLSTSISPERDYIASKVIETIKEIDLGNQSFPLKKDEIILAALKTIYEK